MRCDEARPLLLKGPHVAAEAHLSDCKDCFGWLEAHDPMVGVLQAARPAPVQVPATVSAAILKAWQPQRISVRLGIAAAMALSLIGLAMAAAITLSAPALIASLLAGASQVANTILSTAIGLLAVPRTLFFDQPAALAVFVAATALVCALWARLYQITQLPRRTLS